MAPKRKRAGSSSGSSSRKSSRRNREPTPPPSPPHWRPPPRHAPVVIDVEEETWDIRDPDLDFFVPKDEYRDAPGKFSVAFHHGGSFFNTNDDNKYVGGKLTYFDFYNINNFPLIDLSSMVLKLKYDRKMICEFYYCEPQVRQHVDGSESLRRTFVLRCRRCGQDGHKRRTCTNDPRVDARTEVGQSSQPGEPSDRTKSSNVVQDEETTMPRRERPSTRRSARSSQETNPTVPGPSTLRTRTRLQRCGR
ncbi:uncharacterized protein LOC121764988 [Salvia splendens]|uniref:uncharacterized protein LOC121764988 n=1 Tax=Salvia splendens TaxID=180675 RepID=UPI001C265E7B|nr:uncharacterized protein LOC121764988 [Salvia splendens]